MAITLMQALAAGEEKFAETVHNMVTDKCTELVNRAMAGVISMPGVDTTTDRGQDYLGKIGSALHRAVHKGWAPGERMARCLGVMVEASAGRDVGNKTDAKGALALLSDKYKMPELRADIERAMEIQNPSSGGFLIPDQYLDEVIPFLRPVANILMMGCRRVPITAGAKTHIPRFASGNNVWWGNYEQPNVKASQPGLGELILEARALTALVAMSNAWVKNAGSQKVSQFVLADLMAALGQELTRSAWYGRVAGMNNPIYTNTDYQPLGLLSGTILAQVNHYAGFSGTDLPDRKSIPPMIASFRKQNPPTVNVRWTTGPDLWGAMAAAVSTTGNSLFPEVMNAEPSLMGFPLVIDNQIQAGSDSYGLSPLILADWNEYLIGEAQAMEVAMSNVVSYVDINGNAQNAWLQNQTVLRAIEAVDEGPRQLKAFTIATNVPTKTP